MSFRVDTSLMITWRAVDAHSAAMEVSFCHALAASNRQHRSLELRLKIIQETLMPGVPLTQVMRSDGVKTHQVSLGGASFGGGCWRLRGTQLWGCQQFRWAR